MSFNDYAEGRPLANRGLPLTIYTISPPMPQLVIGDPAIGPQPLMRDELYRELTVDCATFECIRNGAAADESNPYTGELHPAGHA